MTVVTRKNGETCLNKVRVTWADKRWCVERGQNENEESPGLRTPSWEAGSEIWQGKVRDAVTLKVLLTKRSKSHHGTLRESGGREEAGQQSSIPHFQTIDAVKIWWGRNIDVSVLFKVWQSLQKKPKKQNQFRKITSGEPEMLVFSLSFFHVIYFASRCIGQKWEEEGKLDQEEELSNSF